jgi:hypothetical protein
VRPGRLLAALSCGALLVVSGCGSGNSGSKIPADQASRLNKAIAAADQYSSAGRCQRAHTKVRDAKFLLSQIPTSVDSGVRQGISDGLDHLDSLIGSECQAPQQTQTQTTPTQTVTTQTQTQSQTTSTPTTTTPTTTTPTTTTPTPTPTTPTPTTPVKASTHPAPPPTRTGPTPPRPPTPTPTPKPPTPTPGGKCSLDEMGCLLASKKPACCSIYDGGHRTPTPVTPQPVNTDLPESLTKADISAGLAKVQAKAMACGNKFSAKGKVMVAIKVAGSGAVSSVTVKESPDPGLGACVQAAVKAGTYAKTQTGGSFQFPYRF